VPASTGSSFIPSVKLAEAASKLAATATTFGNKRLDKE
jgi:hypothetical protein